MQDYNWLALGGFFFGNGPRVKPFMLNTAKASRLLDTHIDEQALDTWRTTSGLQGVYLVLQHQDSRTEPELTDRGVDADGVHMFAVEHDWLSDRYANQVTGAWQVLGMVSLVLATLSSDLGIPLPRLSSDWYGDLESLPY